ncbi:MAG: hypothetical protein D8M58_00595 [Calditrichaeota bacterium]|nr:MAG: hypothetical protein DWQ03_06485 [Calditrichota bacterium]MBL1203868.1 hypothetical protein [Calditrichota bacterium]NOG43700.1 hypothetical protein [Calditrichota bacterium]
MSENTAAKIHWSFWVIAIVALIWNLMGVMNYLMQMSSEVMASYPESHRAIIESRPAWATGAFAIAVFCGSIGCILLLLKKSSSFYLFIASLVGVILTMIHSMSVDTSSISGPFEMAMMILMPLLVAIFLIWYSKHSENKGWIS